MTYPSSRNPGLHVHHGSRQPGQGLLPLARPARPALTTQQVTGAGYAATDTRPGAFVAPGNASAAVEGAPVYADAAAAAAGTHPVATLPLDDQGPRGRQRRHRPRWQPCSGAHADGSTTAGCAARRSAAGQPGAPQGLGRDDGTRRCSRPTATAAGRLAPRRRPVRERELDAPVMTATGRSSTVTGTRRRRRRSTGTWAPDAGLRRRRHLHAGSSRRPTAGATGRLEDEGTFTVDTTAPLDWPHAGRGRRHPHFAPNGDGYRDTVVGRRARPPSRARSRSRCATTPTPMSTTLDTARPRAPRRSPGTASSTTAPRVTACTRSASGRPRRRRQPERPGGEGDRRAQGARRVARRRPRTSGRTTAMRTRTTITLAFDLLAPATVTWHGARRQRRRRPDARARPGHGSRQAHLRLGRPKTDRRVPAAGDLPLGRDRHERHADDAAAALVRAGRCSASPSATRRRTGARRSPSRS